MGTLLSGDAGDHGQAFSHYDRILAPTARDQRATVTVEHLLAVRRVVVAAPGTHRQVEKWLATPTTHQRSNHKAGRGSPARRFEVRLL
ncbi:MAG: hypothetical protein DLM60_05245 [Pseudonocardiales bacterium]|nr:hypothetical protein [Actinomycetota bacterium]PZS21994.1 MAG: hypothetical protein DLM60_05245 [Pseudonocardiales bacterium]